ncbi:hypothetical protein BT96DRAFT_232288 [Gymnopus androsaceus JB14]|uniref:Uncharacterized protein n=1 Tax=Gymnopus androsaceus JB14 TaxID=1447944 RepID=A0A6A4H706_9AGAR|nr:hypothetical protein BT96DRAFT_232288 [Gymnopus androsaceus JB14]
MLHLRRSRSSASTMSTLSNQQTLTMSLGLSETRSSSGNTTTSTLESMDTRILLERLKVLSNQDSILKEHRQIMDCIYCLVESALIQANLELEDDQIVLRDGVLVGTFIPSMTGILQQTIEYIENNIASPSSRNTLRRRGSLKIIQKLITRDLETFQNNLNGIHSFAMASALILLLFARTVYAVN